MLMLMNSHGKLAQVKQPIIIQVGTAAWILRNLIIWIENQVYFAHDMVNDDDWMNDAIGQMTPNVFITIDLDAFDPSILPSTGTPEPRWTAVV